MKYPIHKHQKRPKMIADATSFTDGKLILELRTDPPGETVTPEETEAFLRKQLAKLFGVPKKYMQK